MTVHLHGQAANPFATRFVRPGAVPFVFATGNNAPAMVERFAALGWSAQIVGPHGSGKSTLIAALAPALAAHGRAAHVIALRDGQRRLPDGWQQAARDARAATIIVDGYEQLGRMSRMRLRAACRAANWALLVTSHADTGLPTLARLEPSLEIVVRIVDRLLEGSSLVLSRELIADRFAEHHGNVRETLFALYDDYEQQRRGTSGT